MFVHFSVVFSLCIDCFGKQFFEGTVCVRTSMNVCACCCLYKSSFHVVVFTSPLSMGFVYAVALLVLYIRMLCIEHIHTVCTLGGLSTCSIHLYISTCWEGSW